MQHEPSGPGTPGAWLRYAQSDLAIARERSSEDVLFEMLCFHAQQAAEKALKAVLVHFGEPVPRTHVIEALADAVAVHTNIPPELREAAILTLYATAARYPGDYEPLTEDDYVDRLARAEQVVEWARSICGV